MNVRQKLETRHALLDCVDGAAELTDVAIILSFLLCVICSSFLTDGSCLCMAMRASIICGWRLKALAMQASGHCRGNLRDIQYAAFPSFHFLRTTFAHVQNKKDIYLEDSESSSQELRTHAMYNGSCHTLVAAHKLLPRRHKLVQVHSC